MPLTKLGKTVLYHLNKCVSPMYVHMYYLSWYVSLLSLQVLRHLHKYYITYTSTTYITYTSLHTSLTQVLHTSLTQVLHTSLTQVLHHFHKYYITYTSTTSHKYYITYTSTTYITYTVLHHLHKYYITQLGKAVLYYVCCIMWTCLCVLAESLILIT